MSISSVKIYNEPVRSNYAVQRASIWRLAPAERQRGVVAASTGNHGKAVAYAARQANGSCTIFAPENADTIKLAAIKSFGATVQLAGFDCIEAESAAREFSDQKKCAYISPYNDPLVIAGQGTIGLEICKQLEQVDAVIASVGGGGMIGGVGSFVKSRFPEMSDNWLFA